MEITVCFTGHRHIPERDASRLQQKLEDTVEMLIQNGATVFRAGGELGFDTMAALAVLSAKRRYPEVRLELILPCPTQTRGWKLSDKQFYGQILSLADSHRYVSPNYFNGVLQVRNRALVQDADVCVAYLTTSSGGTAYTASLALKQGLKLINLQDML